MSLSVDIHSHCGFGHSKALIPLVNVTILDWGSSSAFNLQLISLYLIFYTIPTSAYNFYPTRFLRAQKFVLSNNFIVHPCDGILAIKVSHTSSLLKKTRLENTGMKKLRKKPTIHELNFLYISSSIQFRPVRTIFITRNSCMLKNWFFLTISLCILVMESWQ